MYAYQSRCSQYHIGSNGHSRVRHISLTRVCLFCKKGRRLSVELNAPILQCRRQTAGCPAWLPVSTP